MEIELKYKLKNRNLLTEIWEDEYLKGIEEKGAREKVMMKASYFDTDDFILSKNDIAFRVRLEDTRMIAALKWSDKKTGIGGLHVREELNVPVVDDLFFLEPKPEIFKESEVGRDLLEVLGDKALHSIMEINFLRSIIRLDVGDTICELALDEGEIVTDYGRAPILQMEIELFTGNQEDLLEIGNILADKYSLEPELQSKYACGLELINNKS